MKKSIFVALAALLFATQAMAEGDKHIEVGIMSGGASISGSPITDFGLTADTGKGVRFIGLVPGQTNVEYTLGLSQRKYNISMAGVNLGGGPESTTFSGTVRYRVDANEYVKPYAGVGVHNTNFDTSSLASGNLKLGSANVVGAVAEIGVTVPFKSGFYVDLNARQYFGAAKDLRLETSIGNALLTKVTFKDPTSVMLSVGTSF